jgi:heptosyltransferase I
MADIVLVRMDKIGDLVLSLTADEHPALAGRQVEWLVSKGLKVVADHAEPPRSAQEFRRRFSPIEFIRLMRWLRQARPQTMVFLHNPWWVTCAAWWAGVPERIGRLSQWHSFLFLNLGVRQKRSLSDRHESDYNFDLLEMGFRRLGLQASSDLNSVKNHFLQLRAPHTGFLQKLGLQTGAYRVVHPGMAGSALNWPQDHYRTLIENLASEGPVVVTGTQMDQKFLEPLADLQSRSQIHWLAEKLSLSQLLEVLAGAKSVVAPSTGVVHLAASLGRPVVGLYSPVKVQHPTRWGPKGRNVTTLKPDSEVEGKIAASVMAEIDVEQVLAAVRTAEQRDHGTAR